MFSAPSASAVATCRDDRPRLVVRIGENVEGDRAARACRTRRRRRHEAHDAAPRIAASTHHRRKYAIRPVDQLRLRPEIAPQDEIFDRKIADDGRLPGFRRKPHLGAAEAIDRLHRIADGEERPAVVGVAIPPSTGG